MWEPYSYKFHLFLCYSSITYIAVNLLYSCESLVFEGLLQYDMPQLLFQLHITVLQGNIFH